MKKRIIALLLLAVMLLSLSACGSKRVLSLAVSGIGAFELVETPSGLENIEAQNNVITVTVSKDGQYPFVIRADDGREYTFTLVVEKGSALVEAPEGISISLGSVR